MKDPLTRKEKAALLKNFREEWEKKYTEILKSGSMPESAPHDHCAAKFALILAAERFGPVSSEGKKDLKNVRCFV